MNKTEGKLYCKEILSKPTGYILNDDEFRQVLKFLTEHADVKQKLGIENIYIGNGLYNCKCLFIKRADGSTTDFSYKSCFNNRTKESEFKEACRWCVMPQITEFVNAIFNGKDVAPCAINGKLFKRNEMHVDHYEIHFKDIVQNFIKENNLIVGEVELTKTTDNNMKTEFSDEVLKNNFFEYHKKHAKLRLISKEEHKKAHE